MPDDASTELKIGVREFVPDGQQGFPRHLSDGIAHAITEAETWGEQLQSMKPDIQRVLGAAPTA